jgi:1-acyl-sn-glycerol-3-phosphate acyltransferase
MDVFKKGAYQMAIDLNLPIIPVTINGSFEVLPIHSYFINPHKMEMIIHDPIVIDHSDPESLRERAMKIRALIEKSKEAIESSLWEKYQTGAD